MGPRSHFLSLSLLFLFLLPPECSGAEGRLAHKLFRDLFANYTSALRPVADTDQTLNVTLEVTLSQIIDMDERNQVLTLYLWIRQEWTDAYLRWDPNAYGGLDTIRIPSSLVWRPDIVLYNNAFSGPIAGAVTKVAVKFSIYMFLFWAQFALSLAGKYYMATMTMVTFSTALTILIMNLHYCGPSARPVPAWARALLLRHLARGLCVRERGEPCGQSRPPESSPNPQPPEGEAGLHAGPCHEPQCLCRQEALLHHVVTIANTFHSHRAAQRCHEDWKHLARVMDRFFLGIFFSMALVMSFLVLVQAL
ncbi:neuronal acetylcholine receptor subunit alpha-10 [Carlito syrichta]|uniref:Neuronal acetylcholine receptor subunit alpha-10 n=1 Tax=Carlito syrichta TaxID=1868482 RepID=A0A3Q0EFB6_CARSF|nr:neuronal acetylcholine receptor subunit alpha-10 [Carlito syrichta]